ncbi:hypothetical protein JTE90_009428 [Oedothorax gibbosus]|uniref:Negative elongation factor E n=1 Tax=Oedothorax gibbosus TaxID=931172 RepID=A0AAV6VUZ2_9ARAC|nr:hypothetical protein JTE90_009428 [Oedothorax gibbosus]
MHLVQLPKELSKEEKELQAKYDVLRNLKLKQKLYEIRGSSKHQNSYNVSNDAVQICLKKNAVKVLEKSKREKFREIEINKMQKTCGFKRSLKSNGVNQIVQKKCAMAEFSPKTIPRPRSVTIRGQNLTEKQLLDHFHKFGPINKIRLGSENASAVVTYKTPEDAIRASDDKPLVESVKMHVELAKKTNPLWINIATEEAIKIDSIIHGCNSTVYVSYQGRLTDQDFKYIFGSVGTVQKIYIPKVKTNQFAFIRFEFNIEAERAVNEVNGLVYKGITLSVSLRKESSKDSNVLVETTENVPDVDPRELIIYDCLDT